MITKSDLGAPLPNNHMMTPSQRWHQSLSHGDIQHDSLQEGVLPLLDQVVADLQAPVVRSFWRGVEVWRGEQDAPAIHGVYLYGDVGRGKSMMMQWLFDAMPIAEKRRVHFHPFMEEMHQRLHHAHPPHNVDLVLHVASQLAAEARLLCFDEFYITSVADGVLLGRLLSALYHCGVTLCATSNWAPDHLFQDGFNRGTVLPFIELLKKRIHVCELRHGVDWRRQPVMDHAKNREVTANELFTHLTGTLPIASSMLLRQTSVPAEGMMNGVVWFEFESLCNRILGRAEYIDLCASARMVIISGLPKLSADDADKTMRFVILVDLLYEYRIPLRLYSPVELEDACSEGAAVIAWRRAVSRIHELSRIS